MNTEYRVTLTGLLNWLLAAAIGAGGCVFLLHFAFTRRPVSLQSAVGGLVMGALTFWALAEWNRLRSVSLTLSEEGLQHRSGGAVTAVPWSEVLALEARYVPGLRKKGVADDGNCVSFLVLTAKSGWLELPKELESFAELRLRIAGRTGLGVQQVLIANLTQR